MSLEIGGHVDDPIAAAHADGFPIVQTFLGDPQAWKGHAVPHPGGAAGLKADAEAAGVGLFIHAPYVINVATTNNRIRIPSRQILAKQVKLATEVGARGVIVATGDRTSSIAVTPVPEGVETTGAGDYFAGVLAARIASGADLHDAAAHAADSATAFIADRHFG